MATVGVEPNLSLVLTQTCSFKKQHPIVFMYAPFCCLVLAFADKQQLGWEGY